MKEEQWEKLTNCEKLRCKIADLDLSSGTKNDLVFVLANIEDEISDLEERNMKLFTQLEDRAYEQIKFLYKDYKSRIDKAIEYIKGWQSFPHTNGSTHNELRNLLNILQGEEKCV